MSIAKGLNLRATLEARAATEVFDGQDEADFEILAAEYISRIIDDMPNSVIATDDTWHSDKGTGTIEVKGSFLQDKKGKFISPLNLKRIINLTLYKYATDLMGVNGQLIYQTGRLAHSGIVHSLKGSYGNVSAYFSYMLYPYEVFENNPNMNNGGRRSPVKLFTQAIDAALNDILHETTLKGTTFNIINRARSL